MRKKVCRWLSYLIMLALLVTMSGRVNTEAASKGYVFKYKNISVTMKANATKLLKKAGKPLKKKESKSCAYKGLDRVYQYKHFILATYSNSKKGTQYVNGIKFRTKEVATKEGIRLGSSLNDVFAKYGQKKGKFGIYTYQKGNSKLQFEITDGKVTAIQYVAKK